MSSKSSKLENLTPQEKRTYLARLLRERNASGHTDHPLSYGQRSLWFMNQLAPESTVYNVTTAWRIRSQVDIEALRRSFQVLIDRHAVLRTTFVSDGSEVVQRVHSRQEVDFHVWDAAGLEEARVHDRMVEMAASPFDLQTGPLLRVNVLQLAEKDHVLLIVIHHIACDMWSMELLLKELRTLYAAESSGLSAELNPVVHEYVDYVRWQHELLRGEHGDRLWRFWQDKLGLDLPVLELPTDRPRPTVQTFVGDAHQFTFDPLLVSRLRELATSQQATLFTVFLAAFQILLGRYSRQQRIPVGTPSLGRSRPEFEGIVGYFVNPVILLADLEGDPTFRQFLDEIRRTVFDALDHQDYPFAHLVERLQPVRDPSRSPLADVYFVWDKAQKDRDAVETDAGNGGMTVRLDWGKLGLESFALSQIGTPSDLALLVLEVGDVLSASLGYNTDLFDASTISRMSCHYLRLLESLAENPDQRVSELSILSSQEAANLAVRADSPPMERRQRFSFSDTLHGSFARRADENPDAHAITFGTEHTSYRELDERANRLAHRLTTLGVGPESIVAIYLDRTPELVVAILGVLKAGAAYLPLDRANPMERMEFMLQDSGAEVVVSNHSLLEDLHTKSRRIVDIAEAIETGAASADPAGEHVTGKNLAYVIYTSGSTGQPKGVEVTHGNVMALLRATDPYFKFDENDVWTLFHSAAFDFSVWELFGALLYGGRLVIVPFDVSRSPREFHSLVVSQGVTVLNQTPSAFLPLIEADAQADASSPLRWIIFGGEALDPNSLKPWVARHGDDSPAIVNMYGITETTVHVTFRRMRREDIETSRGSVIGRPLPHLYAYVLGPNLEPVPPGIPGELHVGGAGVARGYLARPELTSERFIRDPYADSQATGRLYRTGDLARVTERGELEYLGRIDQQIKIRGFRIELGEIESVVAQHEGIKECVAMVREDLPGERRIVGYVVANRQNGSLRQELTDLAKSLLPDYMVPTAFVFVSHIPLTANNKVDRNALPVPEREELVSGASWIEPRSPVECQVAQIWQDLLAVDRVGVHDNFFELGGHSVLATQVVDRIRSELKVELPVSGLYEAPTVADLADRVEAIRLSLTSSADGALFDGEREVLEL